MSNGKLLRQLVPKNANMQRREIKSEACSEINIERFGNLHDAGVHISLQIKETTSCIIQKTDSQGLKII